MKKLLVAAGVSAMLIASQAVAFADGAESEDAPRVVDRVSAAVVSPDGVVAPVKLDGAAPVVASGTYNNLISQATTGAAEQAYADAYNDLWACGYGACDNGPIRLDYWMPITFVVLTTAIVVANDDSESD